MSLPASHLQLVSDDGEIVEAAEAKEWRQRYEAAMVRLESFDARDAASAKIIAEQQKKIRRYEGEFADRATRDPNHTDIRDVLLYWRERCATHKTKIVPASPSWNKVRDRLTDQAVEGEPPFTVEDLCHAVDGALLSDFHTGRDPKAGGKTYLRAITIFRDADSVNDHLSRLREGLGRAPRLFEPEARAELVYWLTQECSCGHSRAHHVDGSRGCWAADGLKLCRCEKVNTVEDRIGRWRESLKEQTS